MASPPTENIGRAVDGVFRDPDGFIRRAEWQNGSRVLELDEVQPSNLGSRRMKLLRSLARFVAFVFRLWLMLILLAFVVGASIVLWHHR